LPAKTDNLFLRDKIDLRKTFLPKKCKIYVLSCFDGHGKIWKTIQSEENIDITVTGIDKKRIQGVLVGDNRKFLRVLDLKKYDIVDLDAYGNPFEQIEILIKRKFSGDIFFTWCKRGPSTYPRIVDRRGYRAADIDIALDMLSNYFHKKSINCFDVIRISTHNGFNFYGHFFLT
jgi:hypothetical protein